MKTLKCISVEDAQSGNFGEEFYTVVKVFASQDELTSFLLSEINGESELDTENYYYEVR